MTETKRAIKRELLLYKQDGATMKVDRLRSMIKKYGKEFYGSSVFTDILNKDSEILLKEIWKREEATREQVRLGGVK